MAVFDRRPHKSGRNNEVTVLPISGRKAGFHCIDITDMKLPTSE